MPNLKVMCVVIGTLACGGRRLGPGQTVCRMNQFGVTDCQSAGPGGWWCWTSERDEADGMCSRVERECKRSLKDHRGFFERRSDTDGCVIHDSAVCVRYENTAKRAIVLSCHPTSDGCERGETAVRAHGQSVLSECTVTQ